MIRTTIALEASLFRRLKEDAARAGLTFQECVNRYLRIGMQAWAKARGKGRPWSLPVLSLGGQLVDPADRTALMNTLRRQ